MHIRIQGAREHNLQGVEVEFGDGLTVVTGVSGSGKTSLVFDTLYHEARRRFLNIFSLGASSNRLQPAQVEAITGLGPAVAVGQNLLNRNPGSTLATASGMHPFLRLLFARYGVRGCSVCGAVVSVLSEDEIVARLEILVKQQPITIYAPLLCQVPGSHKTLLSALAETPFPLDSKSPDDRMGRYRLWVDGEPWLGETLASASPHDLHIFLAEFQPRSGADQGKNKESFPGIRHTVQQAAALGALGVLVRRGETAASRFPDPLAPDALYLSRAPVCTACGAWIEQPQPVHFNRACLHCDGKGCPVCGHTGLHPLAAAVRWQGLRLPDLLALSVDQAVAFFARDRVVDSQSSSVEPDAACHPQIDAQISARLHVEITRRLSALQRVGLGYVTLDRPSPSLSRGEAQRVRLAVALVSRLEDMLHVLDEPTVGQHPADVARLLPAFRDLAGPVVFVEHERIAAAAADWAVDLGPGAGAQGGRVVFTGSPAQLWQADTPSGRYFSLRERVQPPSPRPPPSDFLTLYGAHIRNLQQIDIPIPLGRLTVITGVSGSGKSTLVEEVLVASLISGAPVGCQEIHVPQFSKALKPILVDQSPIGRNPRSNPATYTKLADIIRDWFASDTGLSPSHFSFNRPEGACPNCGGLGAVEVTMRYLPTTWVLCAECGGARFSDQVLAARVSIDNVQYSIADFYALSIEMVRRIFSRELGLTKTDLQAARRILDALCDIGLGYLSLGQPSPTLSGGEAQRVKLAKYLGQKSLIEDLLVLDEPSTGLHPQDLHGLLAVLDRLVRAGATIVIVEHNTDVMRAADWIIDLGPGAGPEGGRLLYAGPVDGLLNVTESATCRALREEVNQPGVSSTTGLPHQSRNTQPAIRIRKAHVHNLQNVDVDIPKGKLTVVTGVSGSGKSSLVHDVLEAEARRRFLETLSLYERQGTREGPEAEVESVSGLGVALTVTPERVMYQRRATVGAATEIAQHLAVLMAELGERDCLACGARMLRGKVSLATSDGAGWVCPDCLTTAPLARPRHFSSSTYAAACRACHGVGTLQAPAPDKLIIHPEKPLTNGAMYSPGFFPNGYLGQPFNHGYYMVLALGQRYGFDPAKTPWAEMSPDAQKAFLFGDPEPMTVTGEGRNGRPFTHQQGFPGFYGFVRDWDVGGTYTDTKPCPECHGAGLRPEYLAVKLMGCNVPELNQKTLTDLSHIISRIASPGAELGSPGIEMSLRMIRERLGFLIGVGLGYLHLDRVAGTLSAGEAQRIRLAGLLGSGLTSLTVLLDEPTRGLHPAEVAALLQALKTLRDEGNTVIVVEHDLLAMRAADWLIDVGPGAGQLGGKIVAQGAPAEVAKADTLTGKWLRNPIPPGMRLEGAEKSTRRRVPQSWLTIRGARANHLKDETVCLPLGSLVGVCGVSGSGKSTLVIDTLGRALAPKKQTTSVAYEPIDPGEYDAIEGAPSHTVLVDQSRTGVHSPAAFLGLIQPLRSAFAESDDAHSLGLDEAQLGTRCSVCGGSGVITLDMAFLPDIHQVCETCRGAGFLAEAWNVYLRGISLPEVFSLTIDQVYTLFADDVRLSRPLQAARDVGLGYLVLRQPGYALSGGEAQRLRIAAELARAARPPTRQRHAALSQSLYLLDEPSIGQHLEDVQRLVGVLHRLVAEGGSVILIEHHPHLLAACDWLVELGPGGGPEGGHVIASGTPEQVAAGETPTAPYLREIL